MSGQAPNDLTYASAAALAKAIREKNVSSLEVVDAHLDRIEAVNPQLNAVVQLAGDTAREQAHEADAARASASSRAALFGGDEVALAVAQRIENALGGWRAPAL